MLNAICSSFGIAPDVALRQDPRVVIPIMEFRLAEEAQRKFNAKQGQDMSEAEIKIMTEMSELLQERQPDVDVGFTVED
tara:strand:- start:489 stop:725 length:237 start_codon:yes stop_codon:yes gene_type:complete